MNGGTGALERAVAASPAIAEVVIETGALARVAEVFLRRFGDLPACIIADENTWAAAGRTVSETLRKAGIAVRSHILPAQPQVEPTVDQANALAGILRIDGSIAVAVGSGVMNDIVKFAAFGLQRPYFCVATAASMDGYTSAGSPLSDKGFKKTIQCRPARAILADLDVIAAAPRCMVGWGFGDLAGKVPAGADWIIADALGVEPVDATVWSMVQSDLRGWLGDPAAIASGEPAAVRGLFTGLSMTGFAMERHGSSRPASGADHQIAHLWEMEHLTHGGRKVSHGACVGVATAVVLDLYDWLLRRGMGDLDPVERAAAAPGMTEKADAIRAAFGTGEIADRSVIETRSKHLPPDALAGRLSLLRTVWPDLARRLRAQIMPAPEMRRLLTAAGAPSLPSDIGVTPDHLRRTVANARFLRDRYTLLDLLDETGLLAAALDQVVRGSSSRQPAAEV